jgi:protoheme IX farnesyltransferase
MTGAALATFRDYAALTKPRLLPLVLVTGLPVLGLAGWPGAASAAWLLLGIALAAAAANVLNCYVERDRDALMERTRARPLPAAKLAPGAALRFGVGLAVASSALLLAVGGPAAAALGCASILYYVFVYTVWLKPRSAWNAVVGGAAGAAAPLIADAALNGTITAAGASLFAIVFFWQPPHVWAIALYRKRDYESAGIPMLPGIVGDEAARRHTLLATLGFVPVTLAPVAFDLFGGIYLGAALALDAWFLLDAVRLARERSDRAARRLFRTSLAVLSGLFLAMLVELALGRVPGAS